MFHEALEKHWKKKFKTKFYLTIKNKCFPNSGYSETKALYEVVGWRQTAGLIQGQTTCFIVQNFFL